MKQNIYRGKLTDRFKDLESLRPDLVEEGIVEDGWIYGSLIIDGKTGRTYICIYAVCSHKTYVNNGITTMFEVIPETVSVAGWFEYDDEFKITRNVHNNSEL